MRLGNLDTLLVLVEHDYNLLSIEVNGEEQLWCYDDFEPSQKNSVGSIDFNQMKGVNITPYIIRNKIEFQNNVKNFVTNFQKFLEEPGRRITYRFSGYAYQIYTK